MLPSVGSRRMCVPDCRWLIMARTFINNALGNTRCSSDGEPRCHLWYRIRSLMTEALCSGAGARPSITDWACGRFLNGLMPKSMSGGAGDGKTGRAERRAGIQDALRGREEWSVQHLSIWLGPSIPSLTCATCDETSLVKTLAKATAETLIGLSLRL